MDLIKPCKVSGRQFFARNNGRTKMKTTMKLIVFFFTIACLCAINVHAQRVTIREKNVPVSVIFNQVQKQTGYNFFYSDEMLKATRPVTILANNAPLKDVLDSTFKDQPLIYSIIGESIVVKPKEKTAPKMQSLQNQDAAIKLRVKVTNEKGEPLMSASVQLQNTAVTELTDENGLAVLNGVQAGATIVINSLGYEIKTVTVAQNENNIAISLKEKVSQLQDIAVSVSTGYQSIPKERATGSFTQVNNELLNRRVSTNVLDRLEGIASGVLFPNKTIPVGSNESSITIRGRSTIFANTSPLIILDNFPYDGDINNLNPNAIESITILKDAAAASIWGARSSNGVIVITSKKGVQNQALRVDVNANVTVGEKPNLNYNPNFLDASDFIDIEQFLFSKGYYDGNLNNTSSRPSVSPVVEILARQRAGQISAADAQQQINAYRSIDARNDQSKYLYQHSVNQQYAVNMSGGGKSATYFLGLGYDDNKNSSTYNGYKRHTINSTSTYTPLKNLDFTAGLIYTQSELTNNNTGVAGINQPYTRLVDDNGNPAAVSNTYRKSFTDTAGGGKLLDWSYRPLQEFALNDNTTKIFDVRFTPSLRYSFANWLNVEVKYQYEKSNTKTQFYHSPNTYFARNLTNVYTQINGSTITTPVPVGGILDYTNAELTGQGLRGQLNFSNTFTSDHAITAIAGIESREVILESNSARQYGYSKDVLAATPVDYVTRFATYKNIASTAVIPSNIANTKTTDEYYSYFTNAAYTYASKYTVSFSGRIDQSNLFGVSTNQKGLPLWSAGASWKISSEQFFRVPWVSQLKLRATYGYNGNLDRTVSALLVAAYSPITSSAGLPYASISNPTNSELRWEKNRMINLGLDFTLLKGIAEGSIEYYQKKAQDLIGTSPLPPSVGFSTYKGNVAGLSGNGIDIDITGNILSGKFSWTTNVLFSYNTDKVTSYVTTVNNLSLAQNGSNNQTGVLVPLVGKPLYAIYSFRWAGLDPQTGDPQGYLNKQVSKSYSNILSSTNTSDLIYNGPARPVYFGGWRNTIAYRKIALSFNITYKLGYYFQQPSVFYSRPGTSKYYVDRWQQPGDETRTNVPSFTYPLDANRDNFYTYSEILVQKGDHIRLQDIQVSYTLTRDIVKALPIKQVQIYAYINNVGILWRANKVGIDPDYLPYSTVVFPLPRTYAFGLKTNF